MKAAVRQGSRSHIEKRSSARRLRYDGAVDVMPQVTFLPANVTVEYESGQIPYHEHGRPESLLDIALHFGVPLEHACGGNCACTTCHVVVHQGDGSLSEMEECEEDRLYMAAGLTLHSRLACQAVINGDVVVEIPDWSQNYVSEGSATTLANNVADAKPPTIADA